MELQLSLAILSWCFHPDITLIGKIVPPVVITTERKNIPLSCYSMTRPSWSLSGKRIPLQHIQDEGATFKIINAKLKDTGRYFCNGTNQNGDNFRSYADVYVGSSKLCISASSLHMYRFLF